MRLVRHLVFLRKERMDKDPKKNKKEIWKFVIKIVISASLLVLIFVTDDEISISKIVMSAKQMDLRFAPLIFLFLILNYIISSYRWHSLLVHENVKKVDTKYLIYLYFTGAFFNNVMPTTMGGDVYKIYKLGKKINNTVDAFTATFMERFTGVIALVLISIIGLISLQELWGALLLVAFMIGILVGYLVLGFLSNKIKKLKKIYDSISIYRAYPKVVFIAFLTSFLKQFLAISTQYFIFLALGVKLPLTYTFLFFPIITLAGFLIPSVNGLGVQDNLYKRFFALAQVNPTVSVSASLVYHLFRFSVSLIGGVFYALGKDD